jgi:trimethylamine:corrinoid methyltransferase-like protein
MPRVADRTGYAEWKKDGKKSALVYAKERCESLLATHKAIPLTDGQEAEIESILDEDRSHYKKQGLWV